MLYTILRFFSLLLSKLFFQVSWGGVENIPKKGGFILASNHTSFLDPIIIGVASPRKLNFMARENLFHNKFFGWFLTSLNTFPLKRGSADVSALKEALSCLKQGEGLVLFPGGTRTQDGTLGNFYEGVGFLAVKAKVSLIPTFIKGSSEAWPRDAKFIKPCKIHVFFGRPIDTLQFCGIPDRENYKKITEEVFKALEQLQAVNPVRERSSLTG